MPVDPGNLMLVGKARGVTVLGAPGCARSPKENGFDWVLMRLLAGLPVAVGHDPAEPCAALLGLAQRLPATMRDDEHILDRVVAVQLTVRDGVTLVRRR